MLGKLGQARTGTEDRLHRQGHNSPADGRPPNYHKRLLAPASDYWIAPHERPHPLIAVFAGSVSSIAIGCGQCLRGVMLSSNWG